MKTWHGNIKWCKTLHTTHLGYKKSMKRGYYYGYDVLCSLDVWNNLFILSYITRNKSISNRYNIKRYTLFDEFYTWSIWLIFSIQYQTYYFSRYLIPIKYLFVLRWCSLIHLWTSFQLQLSSSKMMKINLYFDVIWVPLYLWQPILTHMWFHSSNFRRIDYLISKNKFLYHHIK